MRLPPFDYLAPRTIDEAVKRLAERAPEPIYVAGGTDLFPNMKRRQIEPKYLVGLSGLRLRVTPVPAGQLPRYELKARRFRDRR